MAQRWARPSLMRRPQFLYGIFNYEPVAGTYLNAGQSQALRATFTPTDSIDYTTMNFSVLIDVAPAPLTITANSASKIQGQANPAFSVRYSGFVLDQGPGVLHGTLTITTTASAASPSGSYPIIAGGLSSPNYAITYVNGTLTVAAPPIPLVTVSDVQWTTEKLTRKKSIKVLEVTFSGALDADDADDVAAYVLDAATHSKKLGTLFNKPVPFSKASYTPNTVTLTPKGKIPTQEMQLTINASLVLDAEGRQIDGNDDGQPGGNYVRLLNSQGVIGLALPSVRASRVSAEAFDALVLGGHLAAKPGLRTGHSHPRH